MNKKLFLLSYITLSLLLFGCTQNVPAQDPSLQKIDIPEAKISLFIPNYYKLKKINNEPNRAGSFSSYNFESTEKSTAGKPYLTEVRLSSKQSIENFNKECQKQGDNLCFEGNFPTLESYDAEKKAISEKISYKDKQHKLFDSRSYLTKTYQCSGDSCLIKNYTTFVDDIEIDFSIFFWPLEDKYSDEPNILSDQLFQQLKIQPIAS